MSWRYLLLECRHFLFQSACLICRDRRFRLLCPDCANQIANLPSPACEFCLHPLPEPGAPCSECLLRPPRFQDLTSTGVHEGNLRTLIHALKYGGAVSLARLLGDRMADAWLARGLPRPDLLVPVPLHADRGRSRGYNQAALLARQVARRLHCPVAPQALQRVKETFPQATLTRVQREANLQGAFAPGPQAGKVRGKRIVVVDDVFTSGMTSQHVSRSLHDAGAAEIHLLTAARALLLDSV